MTPHTTSHSIFHPRIVLRTAAGLLVTASAGFGATYAWMTGSQHGIVLGALSVAMAAGLEMAKPFAAHLAFTSARSKQWGSALAMSALAFVAVAYSLTAELSLMAMARGDLAAERVAQVEPISLAKEDRGRALDELHRLGAVRTAGEVEADLAKEKLSARWRKSNGCQDVTLTATADFCQGVQVFHAELASAKRAEELERKVDTLSATIAATSSTGHTAVGDKDPTASALTTYLAALGVFVQPETVSRWVLLVPVLALEIGSTLSVLAVSLVSSGVQPSMPKTSVPSFPRVQPPSSGVATTRDLDTKPMSPRNPEPGLKRAQHQKASSQAVLNLLRAHGGRIEMGQRAIGKALGLSKSRVGQVLHSLAIEGAVVLNVSRSGTLLSLPTMA